MSIVDFLPLRNGGHVKEEEARDGRKANVDGMTDSECREAYMQTLQEMTDSEFREVFKQTLHC